MYIRGLGTFFNMYIFAARGNALCTYLNRACGPNVRGMYIPDMYLNHKFWPYAHLMYILDMYLNRTLGPYAHSMYISDMYLNHTFGPFVHRMYIPDMYLNRTFGPYAHRMYIRPVCVVAGGLRTCNCHAAAVRLLQCFNRQKCDLFLNLFTKNTHTRSLQSANANARHLVP